MSQEHQDDGVYKNAKNLQSKLEEQLLPILKGGKIEEKRKKVVDIMISGGFDIF